MGYTGRPHLKTQREKKRSEKKRKLTFLTAKLISRVILKQRLFMVKFQSCLLTEQNYPVTSHSQAEGTIFVGNGQSIRIEILSSRNKKDYSKITAICLLPNLFCHPLSSLSSVGEDDNASSRQYFIHSIAPKDTLLGFHSRDTAFPPSKDVLRLAGQMLLGKTAAVSV